MFMQKVLHWRAASAILSVQKPVMVRKKRTGASRVPALIMSGWFGCSPGTYGSTVLTYSSQLLINFTLSTLSIFLIYFTNSLQSAHFILYTIRNLLPVFQTQSGHFSPSHGKHSKQDGHSLHIRMRCPLP